MQKTGITLLTALLLAGCTAAGPVETTAATPTPAGTQASGAYGEYAAVRADQKAMESYTAAVKLTYDMEYENGSRSVYDLDGVIENGDPEIHLTQHINADGIQSDTEGWYDGSRLYMTYNTVEYYEDMPADAVRAVMLVPVEPITVAENAVETVDVNANETETEFVFHLNTDQAKKLFDGRYDIYGLKEYDPYAMEEGTVVQAFDPDGQITREETSFRSTVTVNGISVSVHVNSSVNYMKVNATDVNISEGQKDAFAAYVNFRDIDTSAITEADVTSDYAEADPIETLKKRLKHRLNYDVRADGTYQASFNETESYTFDFANSIFTYSNRSSHYIYNWRGNLGGFGSTCTFDFNTDTSSEGCDESVVNTMKEVRNYFLMELYYCGLSLDEIRPAENE